MSQSFLENLRNLNNGYEDDVAELGRTEQLYVLRDTIKRLRGTRKADKLKLFREAEPFRKIFGVSTNEYKKDLVNLSYHLDNIKQNGLTNAAKAYLAWLCVNFREPNGEAEQFYYKTGLNKLANPYRRFIGNPIDAFATGHIKVRGEKLGYLDHGFANRVYNERDWDIARQRVVREQHLKTGSLSFSKLRIDSLPSEAFNMDWLTALDCSVTLITAMPDLSGLNNLKTLDVSYSPIGMLPDLSKCASLKTIFMGVSNMENLSCLQDCESLTSLYCGSTSISSLEPLSSCVALSTIHCEDTWISSLDGLEKCLQLQTVDCHHTAVSDLSPLENCPNLSTLILNDCHLTEDAEKIWSKSSLREVFLHRGIAKSIPDEKLSRSSDENCLFRIREFLRLRAPT